MKKLIVRILKSNAVGRWLYKPLRALYRLYSVPHRQRLLKRYGPEVLHDLAEIFKRHQIPAFAAYGTQNAHIKIAKANISEQILFFISVSLPYHIIKPPEAAL